jgi:hypothetical protein
MAGPPRKRQLSKSRLPLAATGMPAVAGRLGPIARRPPPVPEEDSIYTLRGYKAWAARVKAAWDAES